MGLAIPRPSMRQGEERRIRAQLQRHAELTTQFVSEGMSREEASRKAYAIVTTKPAK
jgi:hypothetical protein